MITVVEFKPKQATRRRYKHTDKLYANYFFTKIGLKCYEHAQDGEFVVFKAIFLCQKSAESESVLLPFDWIFFWQNYIKNSRFFYHYLHYWKRFYLLWQNLIPFANFKSVLPYPMEHILPFCHVNRRTFCSQEKTVYNKIYKDIHERKLKKVHMA